MRSTPPLRAMPESIGLALAGRAGARLAERGGAQTGRSTCVVRALPGPEPEPVRALGIDDIEAAQVTVEREMHALHGALSIALRLASGLLSVKKIAAIEDSMG